MGRVTSSKGGLALPKASPSFPPLHCWTPLLGAGGPREARAMSEQLLTAGPGVRWSPQL